MEMPRGWGEVVGGGSANQKHLLWGKYGYFLGPCTHCNFCDNMTVYGKNTLEENGFLKIMSC